MNVYVRLRLEDIPQGTAWATRLAASDPDLELSAPFLAELNEVMQEMIEGLALEGIEQSECETLLTRVASALYGHHLLLGRAIYSGKLNREGLCEVVGAAVSDGVSALRAWQQLRESSGSGELG